MGSVLTGTYTEKAISYARSVVDGEIPANKWVILACKRQLTDLEREDFDWYFDVEKAERICAFIELLPHVKGKQFVGKRITLEPWQCFVLTTIFGWVHKLTGFRRFKHALILVPRKNAKTTIASGVGLYMLAADGEPGAEVYAGATTRDQAQICWKIAHQMVARTAGLRTKFGVEAEARAITVMGSGSYFKPLSRDQQGNHDGLNVHCAILDELHAHKQRDLYDVIDSATGSRTDPLIMSITTAGNNRAGVCYEQLRYLRNILEGKIEDDEYFGIEYGIDEGDDPFDEATWRKANPNYGVSVDPDDMRRMARKAMHEPSAKSNFLTKRLNEWVNADNPWLDISLWEQCKRDILPEEYKGRACYVAADLATRKDICSVVVFYPDENFDPEDPTSPVGAIFSRHFIPEGELSESTNASYEGWAEMGRLVGTPGNRTNFAEVEEYLASLDENYQVEKMVFDEWQAVNLMQRLADQGIECMTIRMTTSHLSEPMKELESTIASLRVIHDGCPVLGWMMGNVVCHTDAKDNIFPRKETDEKKIDGAVAAIMAMAVWMNERDEAAFQGIVEL